MNLITERNFGRIFWNMFLAISRMKPSSREEVSSILFRAGIQESRFMECLEQASRREAPDLDEVRQIRFRDGPGDRLDGMSLACFLISDGADDCYGYLGQSFKTLAANAHFSRIGDLNEMIWVTHSGRKTSPFDDLYPGDGEVVSKLRTMAAESAFKSMANRLGAHVLKSAWVLVSNGLAGRLARDLNAQEEQVQDSLDAFAEEQGLS